MILLKKEKARQKNLALSREIYYFVDGAPAGARALSINGRRFVPLSGGEASCPLSEKGKGVVEMDVVTYEGLFQFCMALFAFASLVIAIINNKK